MALPHYFLDTQVISSQTEDVFNLDLSREDLKHALVARLSPGEHIAVIDASKDYFECEVISINHSALSVRIASHEDSRTYIPHVELFQGLAKGDKMETVIRHATELGVCAFHPLACTRSVMRLKGDRADKKRERWQAIARSAAMQSGQREIPYVYSIVDVAHAVQTMDDVSFDRVVICWEEASVHGMPDALKGLPDNARVALVVGPEGGLDPREVAALSGCHAQCETITLGPSILRTETAGIVASALAIYEMGGLR